MIRRNFIKNSILTSTGLMLFPSFTKAGFAEEEQGLSGLEKYFLHPPASARPWCFYMWMNGNITKEGITADLEAMKRMGIGGAICFNSAVGIPRGPVDYAGEVWMDATVHAVKEASRLGLELTLHNSPGYSGCGGPWVTPEMSMQQLVWTETLANGNENIHIQLPQPYAKHNYYRDAFVIAYPSLPVEEALMKDKLIKVWINGKEVDKNILTDSNPETKIRLEITNNVPDTGEYDIASGTANNKASGSITSTGSSIVFAFAEPFTARAIAVHRKPEIPKDLFDGPRDHPPVLVLESSNDGISYSFTGIIKCPELREMDTPATLSFNAVAAKYFRLVAATPTWINDVQLYNGPRLGGWAGKTNCTHGDSAGYTPAVENEWIIDPAKVLDISDKMDSVGNLEWNAPPGGGQWTLLRIGHTTTGEECAAHPDAGKGLEIDKFRKEAVDFHFEHFLDKLLKKIPSSIGNGFKGITVDSWEAGKQNWTINFPAEFKSRKNYAITSWMPAMTGRIVGSIDDTERFLWDIRKTHADLLAENFYGYYADSCHKRGMEFYAEPYGDGTFDSLQVAQHLDITMSEFWTRYIYGSDIYSKQAVSAAHIYGKKIVAAEAFTAMPATAKWTDYPYSLKAEGDYFFTLGVNRLVFHTFVHQPYMTGKPGMTMGPFGMHIDRNNTWTEQAYGWTGYLQRSQYLLQQGLAVADLCYFKGDVPESGVPDIYKFLPRGYAGDVLGADALQYRLSIREGEIVLRDGMQYRICMLAPLQQILPSTFNKIKDLVNEGMILLVNNKPSKAYGYPASDSEVQSTANELYGALDGKNITERNYGKGKIIWNSNIQQVFEKLNIEPDFAYTAENPDAAIHYIHKIIGTDEFYFISNHKRRRENIVCSFRLTGKQPEIWNSETGKIYEAVLYETINGRLHLPLELEPAAALFVVFRRKAAANGYISLVKDDKPLMLTQSPAGAKPALYSDTQNNFTITTWAKPDSFAHPNKSMLFHAPEGEILYGNNHAAMALSAGQNVVRIYERGSGPPKEVLVCNNIPEGWMHIAVVYENGKPLLYLNGKLAAQNNASGKIVHPGLSTDPSPEQFASYFEGNYTAPQLSREVLNEQQINKLYNQGLPQPLLPCGIRLAKEKNKLKVIAWQNGTYSLQSKKQTKLIGNITGCKADDITGEWKVKFPGESGAPAEMILPSLISLHKHKDFNIKHFSGTCSYIKTVLIAANDLQPGKRLYLHLGRVEVVAEVKVNGKKIGLLWKEPFMADITNTIKPGNNQLEIEVTNLWANRLIGDEQLTIENKYSPHKFINRLPDWYVNNQPKPGERKSFAVWKTHEKSDPLLESGLLGPVKLITAIERQVLM